MRLCFDQHPCEQAGLAADDEENVGERRKEEKGDEQGEEKRRKAPGIFRQEALEFTVERPAG